MATLSKEQIVAASDISTRTIHVPEWGGDVIVKTLTGEERDSLEASIIETNGRSVKQNRENVRSKLLVRALVDEQGQRLFSDGEVAELGRKSASVLDRLFAVATEMSRVSPGDVDELAKNSDPGPSAGSGS